MPIGENYITLAIHRRSHQRSRSLAGTLGVSQSILFDAALSAFEALPQDEKDRHVAEAARRLAVQRRLVRAPKATRGR